jgi:hypothetical protein
MNNVTPKPTKAERRDQKKNRKMKVSGGSVKQLRQIIAKKDKKV